MSLLGVDTDGEFAWNSIEALVLNQVYAINHAKKYLTDYISSCRQHG